MVSLNRKIHIFQLVLIEREGDIMLTDIVEFDQYLHQRGELNETEFNAVKSYETTSQDALSKIMFRKFLTATNLAHLVDESDYEVASKILGALKDRVPVLEQNPGIPNFYWVLTETYLMRGKIPEIIYQAKFPNL